MVGPDASWRVEEAKLLWAQGQRDTAVALARSLLGARHAGAGRRLQAAALQRLRGTQGQSWQGFGVCCLLSMPPRCVGICSQPPAPLLPCRTHQHGGSSGSDPEAAMQYAYLRSLTAKWLSCTRSDSPSTVLSLMQARLGAGSREAAPNG